MSKISLQCFFITFLCSVISSQPVENVDVGGSQTKSTSRGKSVFENIRSPRESSPLPRSPLLESILQSKQQPESDSLNFFISGDQENQPFENHFLKNSYQILDRNAIPFLPPVEIVQIPRESFTKAHDSIKSTTNPRTFSFSPSPHTLSNENVFGHFKPFSILTQNENSNLDSRYAFPFPSHLTQPTQIIYQRIPVIVEIIDNTSVQYPKSELIIESTDNIPESSSHSSKAKNGNQFKLSRNIGTDISNNFASKNNEFFAPKQQNNFSFRHSTLTFNEPTIDKAPNISHLSFVTDASNSELKLKNKIVKNVTQNINNFNRAIPTISSQDLHKKENVNVESKGTIEDVTLPFEHNKFNEFSDDTRDLTRTRKRIDNHQPFNNGKESFEPLPIEDIIKGIVNPEELQNYGGFGSKLDSNNRFSHREIQTVLPTGRSFDSTIPKLTKHTSIIFNNNQIKNISNIFSINRNNNSSSFSLWPKSGLNVSQNKFTHGFTNTITNDNLTENFTVEFNNKQEPENITQNVKNSKNIIESQQTKSKEHILDEKLVEILDTIGMPKLIENNITSEVKDETKDKLFFVKEDENVKNNISDSERLDLIAKEILAAKTIDEILEQIDETIIKLQEKLNYNNDSSTSIAPLEEIMNTTVNSKDDNSLINNKQNKKTQHHSDEAILSVGKDDETSLPQNNSNSQLKTHNEEQITNDNIVQKLNASIKIQAPISNQNDSQNISKTKDEEKLANITFLKPISENINIVSAVTNLPINAKNNLASKNESTTFTNIDNVSIKNTSANHSFSEKAISEEKIMNVSHIEINENNSESIANSKEAKNDNNTNHITTIPIKLEMHGKENLEFKNVTYQINARPDPVNNQTTLNLEPLEKQNTSLNVQTEVTTISNLKDVNNVILQDSTPQKELVTLTLKTLNDNEKLPTTKNDDAKLNQNALQSTVLKDSENAQNIVLNHTKIENENNEKLDIQLHTIVPEKLLKTNQENHLNTEFTEISQNNNNLQILSSTKIDDKAEKIHSNNQRLQTNFTTQNNFTELLHKDLKEIEIHKDKKNQSINQDEPLQAKKSFTQTQKADFQSEALDQESKDEFKILDGKKIVPENTNISTKATPNTLGKSLQNKKILPPENITETKHRVNVTAVSQTIHDKLAKLHLDHHNVSSQESTSKNKSEPLMELISSVTNSSTDNGELLIVTELPLTIDDKPDTQDINVFERAANNATNEDHTVYVTELPPIILTDIPLKQDMDVVQATQLPLQLDTTEHVMQSQTNFTAFDNDIHNVTLNPIDVIEDEINTANIAEQNENDLSVTEITETNINNHDEMLLLLQKDSGDKNQTSDILLKPQATLNNLSALNLTSDDKFATETNSAGSDNKSKVESFALGNKETLPKEFKSIDKKDQDKQKEIMTIMSTTQIPIESSMNSSLTSNNKTHNEFKENIESFQSQDIVLKDSEVPFITEEISTISDIVLEPENNKNSSLETETIDSIKYPIDDNTTLTNVSLSPSTNDRNLEQTSTTEVQIENSIVIPIEIKEEITESYSQLNESELITNSPKTISSVITHPTTVSVTQESILLKELGLEIPSELNTSTVNDEIDNKEMNSTQKQETFSTIKSSGAVVNETVDENDKKIDFAYFILNKKLNSTNTHETDKINENIFDKLEKIPTEIMLSESNSNENNKTENIFLDKINNVEENINTTFERSNDFNNSNLILSTKINDTVDVPEDTNINDEETIVKEIDEIKKNVTDLPQNIIKASSITLNIYNNSSPSVTETTNNRANITTPHSNKHSTVLKITFQHNAGINNSETHNQTTDTLQNIQESVSDIENKTHNFKPEITYILGDTETIIETTEANEKEVDAIQRKVDDIAENQLIFEDIGETSISNTVTTEVSTKDNILEQEIVITSKPNESQNNEEITSTLPSKDAINIDPIIEERIGMTVIKQNSFINAIKRKISLIIPKKVSDANDGKLDESFKVIEKPETNIEIAIADNQALQSTANFNEKDKISVTLNKTIVEHIAEVKQQNSNSLIHSENAALNQSQSNSQRDIEVKSQIQPEDLTPFQTEKIANNQTEEILAIDEGNTTTDAIEKETATINSTQKDAERALTNEKTTISPLIVYEIINVSPKEEISTIIPTEITNIDETNKENFLHKKEHDIPLHMNHSLDENSKKGNIPQPNTTSNKTPISFNEIIFGVETLKPNNSKHADRTIRIHNTSFKPNHLRFAKPNSHVEVTVVSAQKSVSVAKPTRKPILSGNRKHYERARHIFDKLIRDKRINGTSDPERRKNIRKLLSEIIKRKQAVNATGKSIADDNSTSKKIIQEENIEKKKQEHSETNIENKNQGHLPDRSIIISENRAGKEKSIESRPRLIGSRRFENFGILERVLNTVEKSNRPIQNSDKNNSTDIKYRGKFIRPNESRADIQLQNNETSDEMKRQAVRQFIENLKLMMKDSVQNKDTPPSKFERDLSAVLPKVNQILHDLTENETIKTTHDLKLNETSTEQSERIPISTLLKIQDALTIVADRLESNSYPYQNLHNTNEEGNVTRFAEIAQNKLESSSASNQLEENLLKTSQVNILEN